MRPVPVPQDRPKSLEAVSTQVGNSFQKGRTECPQAVLNEYGDNLVVGIYG